MLCPACSGKKYRDLRIRPDEGLCPKCEGAGSVKEEGKEGSWLFEYVPCKDCGGKGIKSLISGGKPLTEAMVMASGGGAPFTGMGGGRVSDTDVEVEEDTEPEEEPEDDRGFISKYRWYLVGGGGVLLVLALLASQGSKRK